MANNCNWSMRVVGRSKESVDRMFDILSYKDGEFRLYRVFRCDRNGDAVRQGPYWTASYFGDVAWATAEWVFGPSSTDRTGTGSRLVNLPEICRSLGVGVEVWSEEFGRGLQEHFVITAEGAVTTAVTYEDLPSGEITDDGPVVLIGGFGMDFGIASPYDEIIGDRARPSDDAAPLREALKSIMEICDMADAGRLQERSTIRGIAESALNLGCRNASDSSVERGEEKKSVKSKVTAEELARLVSEWEKIDDEVARFGWDCGRRDEAWDNARMAMVGAAANVDKTETEHVSNMAAMREALKTLLNLAYEVQDLNSECGPKTSVPAQFLIDVAKSALAASPRNCDVGTAEEQAGRFAELCTSHSKDGARGICDEKCPFFGKDYGADCALAWAQMPCEKEEPETDNDHTPIA